MSQEHKNLLLFYRSEIKFESQLLSGCLSSLIASQSFLLIGYASAMSNLIGQWHTLFTLVFRPVLTLLGLILALQAWVGIRAALAVIAQWHHHQTALCADNADVDTYCHGLSATPHNKHDDNVNSHRQHGGVFAKYAPLVFAGAWCYLAVLPIYVYLRG